MTRRHGKFITNHLVRFAVRVMVILGVSMLASSQLTTLVAGIKSAGPDAPSARVMCENDPALVGCWRMEEGSGTLIQDGGAEPYQDGTLFGTPSFVTGMNGAHALRLSGTGQYGAIPDSDEIDFTHNNLTFAAWVKSSSTSTQFVLRKYDDTTKSGYEFGITTTTVFIRINGSVSCRVDSGGLYNFSTWHHIAASYNGNHIFLYVDGLQNGSSGNNCSIKANNLSLGIGGHGNGEGTLFNGSLDDVRIYSRVLQPYEIARLASLPPPGDITPPGKPVGLTVIRDGNTARLSWNASPDPDLYGYNIFRSTESPVTIQNSININTGDNIISDISFIDSVMSAGQDYFYVVTAVDTSLNRSVFSDEVTTVPTSVAVLSFEADHISGAIHLTWQTANEINLTGFNLYRSAGPTSTKHLLAFLPADHPGQMLPGSYEYTIPVNPGESWYYWLEVVGTGEWLGSLGPLPPPPLPFKVMLPLLTR